MLIILGVFLGVCLTIGLGVGLDHHVKVLVSTKAAADAKAVAYA